MIVDETRLEAFAQFGLGKPRDHNGGGAEHLISITKRVCITIIVIITVVSSRHWCLMASRADDPSSRCTSSDGIRYGLGKPRNDEGADACPRSGPRTRPAASWYASNASAPGSHSNRRGGVAVPPRHVRHLGHDVPRAVAPRSGAAQWRRAVAPQVPRSRRRASDQLHRAGLRGERTAQRRERVRNRAQREGGNARRPECRGDARLDTMQPSRSQLLKA